MKEDRYHKHRLANHVLHPETLMLGYGYDPLLSEGAVKPPVFLTSTFVFRSAEEGRDFFDYTAGRREPPKGAGGRPRLFALQPPQQRDRRGPAGGLRGRRGLHPVLVGHVGDRHHHPDLHAARRRHPALAAALRRHRDAGGRARSRPTTSRPSALPTAWTRASLRAATAARGQGPRLRDHDRDALQSRSTRWSTSSS